MAGSGIGKATAALFAAEGASVVLLGRTASKVDAVTAEIAASGAVARAHAVDVADRDAVHNATRAVFDEFGRVDVLVNGAGHNSHRRRLLSTTPEDIRRVLDSNLVGTIYCAQAVVPAMLEAGRGTIINVSSLAAVNPGPLGGMIYSAAKAAVNNFTAFLNVEFKNRGIRASVVIPGEVDTPILDDRPVPPSMEARGNMVTAEDVAQAILLIARLPQKSAIPELVIRPTLQRDRSGEQGPS